MPFDISLTPEGDSYARLVLLTADFVHFRSRPTDVGGRPDVKCVVFDLDHTLWEGILLENPDVQVRPGVKELLETLDGRGILLSVVSKNTHEHAWSRLEELGLAEYFLHPAINWMPKSQNLKVVADRLNINLDTFAFVDDNPFELEQVASVLPMVECVPVEEMATLPDRPRYRGSSSVEARLRRQFYRDAMAREQVQQDFGEDYRGFLASCGIQLEIDPFQDEDLGRVVELVQRTNQLNFSGRKYERDRIESLIADEEIDKYVIRCSDRFGSYGTVGFSLVKREREAVRIDDFMLSCRVQGKFIEQAFFHHLMRERNPDGRHAPGNQLPENRSEHPGLERAGIAPLHAVCRRRGRGAGYPRASAHVRFYFSERLSFLARPESESASGVAIVLLRCRCSAAPRRRVRFCEDAKA